MSLKMEMQEEILSVLYNNTTKPKALPFNLIRKHDKTLAKQGDFSFPDPGNTKAWKSELDTENLQENFTNIKLISRVVKGPKFWIVFLNRTETIERLFQHSSSTSKVLAGSSYKVGCPDNVNGDLTSARAAFFAEILENCAAQVHVQDLKGFYISTAGSNIDKMETSVHQTILVGPVLGSDGKKATLTMNEYRDIVRERIEALDAERSEDGESIQVRDRRLEALTSAEVRLSLISSNAISETSLPDAGYSSATFIMYNSARVAQILASFDASVQRGVYPALPASVDWSLLNEEEEWEICFNYLLPYQDLLQETVGPLRKLHGLPLHLAGLSKSLSRYYSRVKILRDPLPNLIPVIHARIRFLEVIQAHICSSLAILGLSQLKKM